ncbi:MAG: UDP-3-O-acyl-N-acetylglucosamine deacetylase, partial [Fimbriimonadaceae bacterium]
MTEFTRLTLADEARVSGNGLHSGAPVEVVIEPHEDGVVFATEAGELRACPTNVSDTSRCTCLGPVHTVEHLLSALAGFGVTDAQIHVHGPEMPALDGSSAGFLAALRKAGSRSLGTARIHGLFERCFSVEGEARVAIGVGEGRWRYDFECGERWPHSQSFEASLTPETYALEVSRARTFAFEEE